MVVQNTGRLSGEAMKEFLSAQRSLAIGFPNPNGDATQSLKGKTLLVTGGASGLGESFAKAFAEHPDTAIIIADLNSDRGEELAKTLHSGKCAAKFIQVDVTNWDSVTELFRMALTWLRTLDNKRTIDHVVCSAGVESEELDLTPENPDDFLERNAPTKAPKSLSINVSVIGSLYTVSAAMKYGLGLHLADKGDKSITLLSSLAGYSGMSLRSDYTASKWGVRGLFRSLLDDAKSASCPVRVNLVAPYFVHTPLTAHRVPQLQQIGIKFAALEDVQAAVLRFMSDESVHGRAVGIWQGGPVDLGDDLGGEFGSAALRKGIEDGALVRGSAHVSKRRERL